MGSSDLKSALLSRGRALAPAVLAAAPAITDGEVGARVRRALLRDLDVSQRADAYQLLQGLRVQRAEGGAVTVRWAQRGGRGVYYTPPAIVDHIVAAVLDPLLAGRTPAQVAGLRVIDPSCGAGRFLVGAYRHLLGWHRSWYRRHRASVLVPGSPHRGDVEEGADGTLRLTAQKRAAILRGSIFGADIDPGALDVAAQWLWSEAGTAPDLAANLRCGDALAMALPAGFDAVVGNPPYLREEKDRALFAALRHSRWGPLCRPRMDLCYPFFALGLELLRDGGRLGLITPSSWPRARSAAPLRGLIRAQATIESVVDFHDRLVFEGASIQTMIQIVRKERPAAPYSATMRRLSADAGQPLGALLRSGDGFTEEAVRVDPAAGSAVLPLVGQAEARILSAMAAAGGFQIQRGEVGQGIIGGPDAAFLHDDVEGYRPAERALLRPHHTTCARFRPLAARNHIAYLTRETAPTISAEAHPNLWRRLGAHRARLEGRREVQKGRIAWYHLHWPRDEALFRAGPKLACPTRVRAPSFAVVEDDYYASRAVNMVVTRRADVHYLCGVLNSSAVDFWLRRRGKRLGRMLQIDTGFLLGIPIPDPAQQPALAASIAALSRRLHAAPSAAEEAQLEAAVCRLYGLGPEAAAAIRRGAR